MLVTFRQQTRRSTHTGSLILGQSILDEILDFCSFVLKMRIKPAFFLLFHTGPQSTTVNHTTHSSHSSHHHHYDNHQTSSFHRAARTWTTRQHSPNPPLLALLVRCVLLEEYKTSWPLLLGASVTELEFSRISTPRWTSDPEVDSQSPKDYRFFGVSGR